MKPRPHQASKIGFARKTRALKQPVRNFIGCMDEFSIYSKALKDSDMERHAK